jgi:NADP-dependent 3-hydroxy acid dehydrogenase YdfG
MAELDGRTAIVTGASAGIGPAVVRKLHAEGLNVAFCARRQDRLQALAGALGDRAHPAVVDLKDEGQILAFMDEVKQRFGGVDVLVNNAGLGHNTGLVEGETEKWREMLELNVLALSVCTREALADMHARTGEGHVVHISSMAGHRVPPGSGMYSATKYAVRALTEGLRRELRERGSKVTVTSISPGFVRTEFHDVYYGDGKPEDPYGGLEVLEPEDVANAVWFAISQPSRVGIHDVLMRPAEQLG